MRVVPGWRSPLFHEVGGVSVRNDANQAPRVAVAFI